MKKWGSLSLLGTAAIFTIGLAGTQVHAAAHISSATEKQVKTYMNDTDNNTILVDARPEEAYSGWKLEGAKNGGHLKNATLFSARWLDCSYTESAPRKAYLTRALKDQHITKSKHIIVYDYNGKQATNVAKYFQKQGIKNVATFKANQLINANTDLQSYKNYQRFIPTEIVKNISDVKTGQTKTVDTDTKNLIGTDLNKVVLIDVDWGNAKESTYFKEGHVPGAVHINTDTYERPRVYIPEKRSDYAKEWRLISLNEFRDEVCTQYGITKDSTVILTGSASAPQARLGFMLRSLGVKTYAMSGNLTNWRYNGYKLDKKESTLVRPHSVNSFGSNTIPNPHEILWMDDVKAMLADKTKGQVVDNRIKREWQGKYSGYDYHDLAGHVPGAIWCREGNDKTGELFENVDHTPRTQNEIKAHLENSGLNPNQPMAFYCGDSWGAAKIAYWSQAVDLNNVKEWGDGWIPWSNEGNTFIDHKGRKVHYDKYADALLDQNGKNVGDGINILNSKKK